MAIFSVSDECLYICTVNSEISSKSVKRHICHVKNSRQGHDLLTTVNDRVISPFCEGNFASAKFHENKNPHKNFQIYSIFSFSERTKKTHATGILQVLSLSPD